MGFLLFLVFPSLVEDTIFQLVPTAPIDVRRQVSRVIDAAKNRTIGQSRHTCQAPLTAAKVKPAARSRLYAEIVSGAVRCFRGSWANTRSCSSLITPSAPARKGRWAGGWSRAASFTLRSVISEHVDVLPPAVEPESAASYRHASVGAEVYDFEVARLAGRAH